VPASKLEITTNISGKELLDKSVVNGGNANNDSRMSINPGKSAANNSSALGL